MKRTYCSVVFGLVLLFGGIMSADELTWTWGTTVADEMHCLFVSQTDVGMVSLDWGDGSGEILPVTTGLHVSPLCHSYTTPANYEVDFSSTGTVYYVDLTGQNLTNFSGGTATGVVYLGLAGNPQLQTDGLAVNLSGLTSLNYLVLSDTVSSVAGYNTLLDQLTGVTLPTNLHFYAQPTQYGGCNVANRELGIAGRSYLGTQNWIITDGGQLDCAPQPSGSSGGGGGGAVLKPDTCPNGDFSPSYYDEECGDTVIASELGTEGRGNEAIQIDTETGLPQSSASQGQTDEILTAYDRAYKYGITTLAPITGAFPDGVVIRGEMAKMVTNYVMKVLGWTLPEKVPADCHWKDGANARENQEIKDYAIEACSLGLMGIDMEYFQPNMVVTRAQFGTVLSRILRQTKYAGGTPYYAKHLQALQENGIMSQIDNPEQRQELRQWVRLMLMRSVK